MSCACTAGTVLQGLEREQHLYRPRSMVCYYGAHYQAFVLLPDAGGWALFDDASVSLVGDGSWRAVREKCRLGRIQPSVIFFEAVRAAQRGSAPEMPHAAAAAAPELQPRTCKSPRCRPLVPFPPQRPALVPHAVVARSSSWATGGVLLENGHSGAQLVHPPGMSPSAAAQERSQAQLSLPADPQHPLHAPAFAVARSAAEQTHGEPQLRQAWKHEQDPQQHPSGAFNAHPALAGAGHAVRTGPSTWTVPTREALDALLAAGPPAAARGSPHLPQAFASAAPPSAAGAARHAASLPASLKEHMSAGMAYQQTMLNVPPPDNSQRLLPANGFSVLHGGR